MRLSLFFMARVCFCLPSKSNVLILLKNYLLYINISTPLFGVYFSLFCLSVFLSVFLFVMSFYLTINVSLSLPYEGQDFVDIQIFHLILMNKMLSKYTVSDVREFWAFSDEVV